MRERERKNKRKKKERKKERKNSMNRGLSERRAERIEGGHADNGRERRQRERARGKTDLTRRQMGDGKKRHFSSRHALCSMVGRGGGGAVLVHGCLMLRQMPRKGGRRTTISCRRVKVILIHPLPRRQKRMRLKSHLNSGRRSCSWIF